MFHPKHMRELNSPAEFQKLFVFVYCCTFIAKTPRLCFQVIIVIAYWMTIDKGQAMMSLIWQSVSPTLNVFSKILWFYMQRFVLVKCCYSCRYMLKWLAMSWQMHAPLENIITVSIKLLELNLNKGTYVYFLLSLIIFP